MSYWMKWESSSSEFSVWNTRVNPQKFTLKPWQILRRICCQIYTWRRLISVLNQIYFRIGKNSSCSILGAFLKLSWGILGRNHQKKKRDWVISWASINGETFGRWLNSLWGVRWSPHLLWDCWPVEWKGCNSSLVTGGQSHSQHCSW